MKNLVISSCLLSSAAFASNSYELKNEITSSLFYRSHYEGSYSYEITGLGLHYKFLPKEDLNIELSGLFQFNKSNFFSESEMFLSYNFPLHNMLYFYPIVSGKYIRHHFNDIDVFSLWASKGMLYGGTGFGGEYKRMQYSLDLCLFKDIVNKLTIRSNNDKFTGQFYSNPLGLRLRSEVKYRAYQSNWIGLSGFATKAFDNSYKDRGLELSLQWSF